MKLLLLCASLILAPTLHAEVYKCVDPKTGNMTFSGGACNAGRQGATVRVNPANSMDSTEDRRAIHTLRRQAYEAQQAAYARSSNQNNDYSAQGSYESNIRRDNELRMITPYAGSGGRLTAAQLRTRSRLMGVDSPEPQQVSAPRNIPTPPPTPRSMTNCDGAGCWDNQGERYNRAAGNTYFKSGGGACQGVGDQMICN